jgi:predicted RNase H-like HicB family nuclease
MPTNHPARLKYDVMIEQSEANGYTARVLAWPDWVVQAPTRAEALALACAKIEERLAKAEIVTLEIAPEAEQHPWLEFAGDWANDPGIEEFRASIDQYRREIDAEWAPWLLEPEAKPEDEPEKEAVVA